MNTTAHPPAAPTRPTHLLQRIASKSADHRATGSIVIVALGDSVTAGAAAIDILEPDLVYHQRLKRLLEARYPKAVFSIINSGIGGDGTSDGVARLDRDVLRYQPDLVLVALGLNDASAEPGKLEQFKANLGTIIERIRNETPADVILLTPSFMASRDNDAVAQAHQAIKDQLIERQTSGCLARFAQAIREVGELRGCPVADVYREWDALAQQGVDTTAMQANGLNHPTGEAHAIAAQCVMRVIEG